MTDLRVRWKPPAMIPVGIGGRRRPTGPADAGLLDVVHRVRSQPCPVMEERGDVEFDRDVQGV